MTQVLDEERVERACAEFFGDALWEKFGQTAKSRGRRNIGAAISAYLGETHVVVPKALTEREYNIVIHNGYVGHFSNLESDWSLLLDAVAPPFNVNTGSDSVKTAESNHSPSTLNAETE